MKSKWTHEIKGLEHLTGYKIYENGKIDSHIKRHNKEWIITEEPRRTLKQTLTPKGYLKVQIREKSFSVHRLVALAFIDNPQNKEQINHIDCNKENNNVNNLEWCTNIENHKHKCDNGLNKVKRGKEHYLYGKQGKHHHSSTKVYMYDLEGNMLRSFDSMKLAGEFIGKHYTNVVKCCTGKISSSGGYKWSYSKVQRLSLVRE